VRIALAEKGVEHETVVVDLDDKPDWLYAKNPAGKVPVVEDGSWILPESAVINEYLEERIPEPALLPADPEARAAARLLVFRHDDFSRPYYALRRGAEGATEAFAEARTARQGAVPERGCIRARRRRVRSVADPRPRSPRGVTGAVPERRCLGRPDLRPPVRRSRDRGRSRASVVSPLP
jgi:glutathione S-transferase